MSNLQRVIVVPRNGYINRMQAWASSAILAAEFGARCSVMWEPETVAAAAASDFFREDAIRSTFVTSHELTALLDQPHDSLPRYLTVIEPKGVVVLAGHDRGEQVFMPELLALIKSNPSIHTLIIIAGGKFSLPDTHAFAQKRSAFYAELPWNAQVLERLEYVKGFSMQDSLLAHSSYSYLGLHIRGTDRSLTAPKNTTIESALSSLFNSQELRSLFIAADTEDSLQYWKNRSSAIGFIPWNQQPRSLDRSTAIAGIDAMVDWILLGSSDALVYSESSSYAHEAGIATGNFERCIPLGASKTTQILRKTSHFGKAAVNYARRLISIA